MQIPEKDLALLLGCRNADCIAVYVFCKATGTIDNKLISSACGITEERAAAALSSLEKMGLVPDCLKNAPVNKLVISEPIKEKGSTPSADTGKLTYEDAETFIKKNAVLKAVCSRMAELKTMPLNREEKLDICRKFKENWFPPETFLVLMGYLKEMNPQEFYTVGEILRVAQAWQDMGIKSAEQAKKYWDEKKKHLSRISELRSAMEPFFDARLMETGSAYDLLSWLDDNRISVSELTKACYTAQMSTSPGKNRFGYIRKVLENDLKKRPEDKYPDLDKLPPVVSPRKKVRISKSKYDIFEKYGIRYEVIESLTDKCIACFDEVHSTPGVKALFWAEVESCIKAMPVINLDDLISGIFAGVAAVCDVCGFGLNDSPGESAVRFMTNNDFQGADVSVEIAEN